MVRRLEGELKSNTTTLSASEAEANKYKSKVAQLQVTRCKIRVVTMVMWQLGTSGHPRITERTTPTWNTDALQ